MIPDYNLIIFKEKNIISECTQFFPIIINKEWKLLSIERQFLQNHAKFLIQFNLTFSRYEFMECEANYWPQTNIKVKHFCQISKNLEIFLLLIECFRNNVNYSHKNETAFVKNSLVGYIEDITQIQLEVSDQLQSSLRAQHHFIEEVG